jgi:glycyl-tRNA synthetase beta subunit
VLLSEPAESKLYKQARDVGATVERAVKAGKYKDALAELAKLGPTINAFFDEVLVMAEDQKVRANRISLLGQVAGLFSKLADFGQLQPA